MKLTELHPRWVGSGGPGIFKSDGITPAPSREKIGMSFDCPCGCGTRRNVFFVNPPDGGPPLDGEHATWNRTGETFETMTLIPSILSSGLCKWHGFLTNGEITAA